MSQGSGEGESLGILVILAMQQHQLQALGVGTVMGRGAKGVVCAWPLLPPGARTSPRFLCVLLSGPVSCSQTPVNKH